MLYLAERVLVGGLLAAEDEIAAGFDAVHDLSGTGRTVQVHHIDTDVLHLHIHHPRHDAHDHDGEDKDQFGQKRVAANLQKLFLYEIRECHKRLF